MPLTRSVSRSVSILQKVVPLRCYPVAISLQRLESFHCSLNLYLLLGSGTLPFFLLGIWVKLEHLSGNWVILSTPGTTGSSLANWATGGGRPSPCASQRHTVSVTHTRTFYVQLLPLNSGCKFDSDFRQTRYLTKNLFLSLRHPDFEFEGLTLQRLLLLTLNGLYILQFFYLTPLSQLSLHGDLLPELLL